jgi:hypothetical protein
LRGPPKEILVDIFNHTGIVDHVILSLCSKQLSRVLQDLIGAVVLPRRDSLNYQTYKEHVGNLGSSGSLVAN